MDSFGECRRCESRWWRWAGWELNLCRLLFSRVVRRFHRNWLSAAWLIQASAQQRFFIRTFYTEKSNEHWRENKTKLFIKILHSFSTSASIKNIWSTNLFLSSCVKGLPLYDIYDRRRLTSELKRKNEYIERRHQLWTGYLYICKLNEFLFKNHNCYLLRLIEYQFQKFCTRNQLYNENNHNRLAWLEIKKIRLR